MSLHLDERPDGGFAFFINGDLQFDTADEPLYHESLALPALCLAISSGGEGEKGRRGEKASSSVHNLPLNTASDASGGSNNVVSISPSPLLPFSPSVFGSSRQSLRVLICGGGDGLALRECLRFPGVTHVDLVDYDSEVVTLGRTRFAELNRYAFEDERAHVHIGDAWEFLPTASPYDVILCDFTVPRREEDTRVFTVEWYERVRQALTDTGVAALNAVSPQATPEAFWCLHRTVRAAGLSALPYRVCIPSFRDQGYGVWAFLLASPQPLKRSHLRNLACPVSTRQTDLSRLWHGARFTRAERRLARRVPVHSLAAPCLLRLQLNPGMPVPAEEYSPPLARYERAGEGLGEGFLDSLLSAIPIIHPYHTRLMIETLAEQVIGAVRTLDLQRLVDALLRRAAELPGELLRELGRLRDFLRLQVAGFERCGEWGRKLFVTLVILMTLANSIAPDNAFAKGSFGLGHSSMSRGYSSFGGARGFSAAGSEAGGSFGGATAGGGRSATGSFGGERGIGTGQGRTTGGSFGGERGIGSSFGSGSRRASGVFSPAPAITHSGFRRSYGESPIDADGYTYTPRTFYYGGYGNDYINGGGGYVSGQPPQPAAEHKALFVADDDMLVMENGDVVITLSDSAYLLVREATLSLYSTASPQPLLSIYPDPNLFLSVITQLQDQQVQVQAQVEARSDWLSWVGWTSALSSAIADDKAELQNLQDLNHRLGIALQRVAPPPKNDTPTSPPEPNVTELFVGAFLRDDGRILLRTADGHWLLTDGKTLSSYDSSTNNQHPTPNIQHLLAAALKSVLVKLHKEFAADLASLQNDYHQLQTDRASLQNDMSQYQQIERQNGADYEVDYGTEEIEVSDAISRTQRDLDQNQQDTADAQAQGMQLSSDLNRLNTAGEEFGR